MCSAIAAKDIFHPFEEEEELVSAEILYLCGGSADISGKQDTTGRCFSRKTAGPSQGMTGRKRYWPAIWRIMHFLRGTGDTAPFYQKPTGAPHCCQFLITLEQDLDPRSLSLRLDMS